MKACASCGGGPCRWEDQAERHPDEARLVIMDDPPGAGLTRDQQDAVLAWWQERVAAGDAAATSVVVPCALP